MTLSGLHSLMGLIDLRVMITQDQLTYLTEKQYSIMDVSSNLDSAVFGAQNNPEGEFGVEMPQFDPAHAGIMTAPIAGGGTTVTLPRGPGLGGGFTMARQPDGSYRQVPLPGGTVVNRDQRTGELYAMIPGAGGAAATRQRVYQQITPGGGRQPYYVSGRHMWMKKNDAVAHLQNTRNGIKKEEYRDQQTVKKLQTQLEMLMKQKDQVLGWLKKRLEDWFKGVGEQR